MIRIAICDDEIEIVTELSFKIDNIMKSIGEEAKIYQFTNSNEMLTSHVKFNLIFVDVEMPNFNGIETAERIRISDPHVQIVYVTNYKDYMKKAYRVHAFDYIQKPIDDESINTVINDYIKTIDLDKIDIVELLSIDQEKLLINSNDIIYISCGHKKRTVIVITTAMDHICKGNISDIYDKLNSFDFFMPHRSHIINLSMVKSFKRNDKIVMINEDEIPLSKGTTEEFEKNLAKKMHEKVNRRIL